MKYTIKQVSEITGISTHTLRYYDKQGLFPSLERSEGNYRIFSDREFNNIKTIVFLKTAGLEIKDIKRFMDLKESGKDTLPARYDFFRKQIKELEAAKKSIEKAILFCEFGQSYYKTMMEVGKEERIDLDLLPESLTKEIKKSMADSEWDFGLFNF